MDWLRRFMYGRYGSDPFGIALIGLSLALNIVSTVFRLEIVGVLSFIPAFYCLFRMFSRNITARQAENRWFLKWWVPLWCKVKSIIRRVKDIRKYRYFKCPTCKSELRVPKGKGRIEITCPKCSTKFKKKS